MTLITNKHEVKPFNKFNLHTPERMEGEPFEEYKTRRKKSQDFIKRKLK